MSAISEPHAARSAGATKLLASILVAGGTAVGVAPCVPLFGPWTLVAAVAAFGLLETGWVLRKQRSDGGPSACLSRILLAFAEALGNGAIVGASAHAFYWLARVLVAGINGFIGMFGLTGLPGAGIAWWTGAVMGVMMLGVGTAESAAGAYQTLRLTGIRDIRYTIRRLRASDAPNSRLGSGLVLFAVGVVVVILNDGVIWPFAVMQVGLCALVMSFSDLGAKLRNVARIGAIAEMGIEARLTEQKFVIHPLGVTADEDLPPMARSIDIVARRGDVVLVIEIKTLAGSVRAVDWRALSTLQLAASSLASFAPKIAVEGANRVVPVLILIDVEEDQGLQAHRGPVRVLRYTGKELAPLVEPPVPTAQSLEAGRLLVESALRAPETGDPHGQP